MHQVRGDEPPRLAAKDGCAFIAQHRERMRASDEQHDQQGCEDSRQQPVAEIVTCESLEHGRSEGATRNLL